MNANEQFDFYNPDSMYYANSKHYIAQLEAMLRQQQAEIEALKAKVEFLEDKAVMIDPEEMKQSFVYKHLYGDDMLAAQKRINNLLRKMVDELPINETYNPKKHGAEE